MSEFFMNRQRQQRMHRATAPTPTPSPSPSASFNGKAAMTNGRVSDNQQGLDDEADVADDDDEPFANMLSLKLKKPKNWKWELTTSRSCTNIALPRILLYDHTGELLVDADSLTEQVYRQPEEAPWPADEVGQEARRRRSSTRKRAATSQLSPSIRQALDHEFNGLHIEDATPTLTPTHSVTPMRSSRTSSLQRLSPVTSIGNAGSGISSGSGIDFYTNELPDDDDQRCSRRSSSLRGVRFKVDTDTEKLSLSLSNNERHYTANYPTPPSTVTTTTTTTATTPTNSSSSGPREKRRYRRSHSSSGRSPAHSESILERFSYNKGRFSSPEYAVEEEVRHAPRYFLRTSKAGTLVIQEESFSRQRHQRRRAKHSSSENILRESEGTPKSQSTNSLAKQQTFASGKARPVRTSAPATLAVAVAVEAAQQAQSLQNITELQTQRQKKPHTVRRYRSDGNVLLQRDLATSEEELAEAAKLRRQPRPRSLNKQLQQHHQHQRQHQQHDQHDQQQPFNYSKDYNRELVTIDPDNCVYRAGQAPTAR